jgi:probable rRNA maturation factor
MADKLKVVITDDQKEVKVQTGTRMLIRRCCHAVLESENFPGSAEIGITFTDNERLNRFSIEQFGKSAEASYAARSAKLGDSYKLNEATGARILGDILISFEKAVEEAESSNNPVNKQVAILTANGVLELLGYSPEIPKDKAYIRDRVELIMFRLGIPISSRQFFS